MKNLGRLAALAVGLVAALAPLTAQADWLSVGGGQGQATATSVSKAAQPTATKNPQTSPGSTQVVPAVTLSWAATTLASGDPVGSYEVRRHSGNDYSVVCTVSSPATSCDDNTPLMGPVTYGVVARVGANWVGPESDLRSFQYDTTAPVTTVTQSPAPNTGGWNNSDITVTLRSTDQESGVKSITYTVGGVSTTVNGSTATIPVSSEGSTTITYSATDNVGNTETSKSFTVKLDKTAPTVTATGTTASGGTVASGGTSDSPVTVSLAATDGLSGVQSVSYQVGSAAAVTTPGSAASLPPISQVGTTSVQYWATDVAGNVSAVQTYTVKIVQDATAPVFVGGITGLTAGTTYPSHDDSSGWGAICSGKGQICATVTDAGSGIASVSYTLQATVGPNAGKCWDGSKWVSGSACSVAMSSAGGGVYQSARIGHQYMDTGTYTLTVYATDLAGNQSHTTALTFYTDSSNNNGNGNSP